MAEMYAGFEQVLQLRLCHAVCECPIRCQGCSSTAFISRRIPRGAPTQDPAVCEIGERADVPPTARPLAVTAC